MLNLRILNPEGHKEILIQNPPICRVMDQNLKSISQLKAMKQT